MITIEGLKVVIRDPTSFNITFGPDGVTIQSWKVDLGPLTDELAPQPSLADRLQVLDPVPVTISPVSGISTIPAVSRNGPAEILQMARTGVCPRILCEEFDIQAATLRAIVSGYANYKKYNGSEKVWGKHFEKYQQVLGEMRYAAARL